MYKKVILFAGTTEGRIIYEYLHKNSIPAVVCVTTDYGKNLLDADNNIKILTKPMSRKEMEDIMVKESPSLVIDATHPYAKIATENIIEACNNTNSKYIRVTRERINVDDLNIDVNAYVRVANMEEAISYLENTSGNILATTGSKELELMKKLSKYQDRVYARILPSEEMINKCKEIGFDESHIISLQGPFSEEENYSMIKEFDAKYLLTKESGQVGGFAEKLMAVNRAGIKAVIIDRPIDEEGYTIEEVIDMLGRGQYD